MAGHFHADEADDVGSRVRKVVEGIRDDGQRAHDGPGNEFQEKADVAQDSHDRGQDAVVQTDIRIFCLIRIFYELFIRNSVMAFSPLYPNRYLKLA